MGEGLKNPRLKMDRLRREWMGRDVQWGRRESEESRVADGKVSP